MRRRIPINVIAICVVILTFGVKEPVEGKSSVTIVAVGDIAKSRGGQAKTAALTKNLNPKQVLLLGDLVYKSGTDKEFKTYFLPKWKGLLTKSWAIPGNHEYRTKNAAGYRNLIKSHGMPSTSKDLWWVKKTGAWTVVGLDSEALTGATGKRQIKFLKQTLANNDGRPTIVTWHRPTFSRGYHGDQADTLSFWNLVSADKDVKLVLWGHDHNYEQVERVVQAGTANERKINTIVVGTGGADLRKCSTPNIPGELICGKKNNFGVLQLKLEANAYSWSYRNANGKKLGRQLDSGRVAF
ncbi:MAG: Alkaline phosphatase [Actinomycetota bacterium]|jgi:predicted phosphodiesterase